MGQPAARLGDLTAHGGTVTSGNPTVLIGGQPAATIGDLHVCPLCSPGPHVGGPVLGGAPTVLIGGKPAARVGDMCTCAAPAPDVIVSGAPTVLIGGASSAAPGAAAAAASAFGVTAALGTPGLGATAKPLSPWVGVGYVDAAGRPVTGWHYRAEGGAERRGQLGTGGQVWCDALTDSDAVEVGLVGVYGCQWERDQARVGDAVGMSARCVGVADGEEARFEVWREAAVPGGGTERAKVWEVMGEVKGGHVEAVEPYRYTHASADTLIEGQTDRAAPDKLRTHLGTAFVASVVVGGAYRSQSAPMRLQSVVELSLMDGGRPASGERYVIRFSNGEHFEGRLDRNGAATIDPAPPYRHTVQFPDRPRVQRLCVNDTDEVSK